jgi:uncharacterized membrane protein
MTCEVPISKTDQFCGPAVPKFAELVDALLTLLAGAVLTLLAGAVLTLLTGAVLTLLAGAVLTLLADAVLTLLAGAVLTLLAGARRPPVAARLPSNSLRGTEKAINGPEPKKKPVITARLTKALFLIHELTRAALFIFNLSFTPRGPLRQPKRKSTSKLSANLQCCLVRSS